MTTPPNRTAAIPPAGVLLLCLVAAGLPPLASAAPRRPAVPPASPASPLAPGQPAESTVPTNLMLPAPGSRTLPAPGDPEFEFGGPLRLANTNLSDSTRPPPIAIPSAGLPPVAGAPAPAVATASIPIAAIAPAAATVAPPSPAPAPTDEADWITSDTQPDAALIVRVLPPRDSVLVPGLIVRHMKVAVRNRTTDRAVALRGVGWVHGRGRNDWVKSLQGRSSVTPGGTVTLEPGEGNSDIWFEHGLLLPGQTLKLALPVTPQPSGLHEVEVSYVVVGAAGRPWQDEVLVGRSAKGSPDTFDRPDVTAVAAHNREGGLGLLRAALDTAAPVPDTIRVRFRVGLPLAQGAWLSQLTGGIALEAALALAGASPDSDRLAYYVDAMPAWFFIDPRTSQAQMVFRDGEKWAAQPAGTMEVSAPDIMCSAPDGSTSALLNPAEFGDLMHVQTPWVGKSYNPGKTYIAPSALKAVLQRAAQRSIPVKVVAIDPNGLGFEDLLAIGVQVDVAGRWLSPPVPPALPQASAGPEASVAGPATLPRAPVAATPVPSRQP